MKVIDILDRIANGEEIPQLIKWNGYIYDKLGCEYYMLNDRDITLFGDILDTNGKYLNDEVEIVGEDKKIEKLNKDNFNGVSNLEVSGQSATQFDYVIEQEIEDIVDKINEIIDKLNEMEKE